MDWKVCIPGNYQTMQAKKNGKQPAEHSRKVKTMPSNSKKVSRKENKPCSVQMNYYCIFCNDQYVEPLTEDWIQCDEYKLWAHESCSAYDSNGQFICDECE